MTAFAEMSLSRAMKLRQELMEEKRSGVLADFYVIEHVKTAQSAYDEVQEFLNRSRRECYRE